MSSKYEAGDKSRLLELVRGFNIAMLTSRRPDGDLHSRPMVVADVDPDGGMWFVTDVQNAIVPEVGRSNQVMVTMQSMATYVSVAGEAHIVRDHGKIKKMWAEGWRIWFPNGPADTDLVLIHVEPHSAEYWDNRGLKGLRLLFDAAKKMIRGDRHAKTQEPGHGVVNLHEDAQHP